MEVYCRRAEGRSNITALVTLGGLYRLAGDMDQSEQWIQRAQRADPNHQAVVHARSAWLVAQSRADELTQVSSAYSSAREQNPNTVLTAPFMLAALDSPPLKNEGKKLCEHAVRLASASLPARLGLAATLYQMGEADEAEKACRTLLDEHPDDIRILNDLAWILQERHQRYAEALETGEPGIASRPRGAASPRYAGNDPAEPGGPARRRPARLRASVGAVLF